MKYLTLILTFSITLNLVGQRFKTPISNPFGFSSFGYVGKDHFSSFADLDGDGDKDLLVSDFDGVFHYYQNTGDSLTPVFAQSIPNPFGISVIDYPNCACNTLVHKFVDIDNDGDQDLIALSWWASTYFYAENIGDSLSANFKPFEKDLPWMPANFNKETFVGIDFIDIDNDGDLDFFTCEEEIFSFRENTGTAESPNFTSTLITNAFDINVSGGYLFPSFVDIDDDGDFDLFLGGNKAELNDFQFYENVGNDTLAVFSNPQENPFYLSNSDIDVPSLTFVDLDGDGDKDIFAGGILNVSNDFQYYENEEITNSLNEPENKSLMIKLYPNPTTTHLIIEGSGLEVFEKVRIENVLGETVKVVELENNIIDVSFLSTGKYFIRSLNGEILNQNGFIVGVK